MAKLSSTHIYGDLYVDGSIDGKVSKDSAGQQINTTYIKGLSVSGKTITYTKGDGSTGTITTQDTNTTYSAATQSAAGLMSAADKKKLDGVATSANNYSHPNSGVTAASYGPSANASPAHGKTFSVPYITVNAAGHITAASTKTITLPADNNTWRGVQNNLTSTATDQSLSAAQGKILQDNKADKTLLGEDLSSKTISLNDLNLSSGSPKFKVYYCPTDGGGSNITGRPNDSSKQAFNLIVESLRWASTTDYITKQTYTQGSQKIIYVRYCTNGTWTAWEKVYTSAQKPTAADIGAAPTSHASTATTYGVSSASNYGHAMASGTTPKANGTATVGSETAKFARGDHVHPLQTSVSGNAGTATKLATTRAIKIGNKSLNFDGSAAITYTLDDIGAAAKSHGRHVPDNCTTITDWNAATTNGWYMGNNAANAPTSGSVWYFGEVVAHNTNYLMQTVYQFTASADAKAIPKYIRARTNGTWGEWTNVTVAKAVPSNAVFTDTNTWRGVQNNLTSTATDQSLSANQGRVLKGLVDGKAASSHTHTSIVNQDTRDVNTTPDGAPVGLSVHLKSNGKDGLSDGETYHSSLFIKGWDDYSGGPYGNIAISANNNLWYRASSSGSAWNSWKKVSVDGHTHSYLPLSGGTVTGNIEVSSDVNAGLFRTKNAPGSQNCFISGGNGDAASWDSHNMVIRSHWGIGFRDYQDICRIVMDTRVGSISSQGNLYSGGQLLSEAGLYTNGTVTSAGTITANSDLVCNGRAWIYNATLSGMFIGEHKFSVDGGWADPWSGIGCAIKATGNVGLTGTLRANSGIYSTSGNGVATADGSTYAALLRYKDDRGYCDLGNNNIPGRIYLRSGQGAAGSGVLIECAVTDGNAYMQYVSPEAGTIALTRHLSDRTKKDNITYVGSKDSEFTNKDFYDFIKKDLGLATYTIKEDYATTDTHTKLNFIAQDILYDYDNDCINKVGNLIVQTEDAMEQQGTLQFDPDTFTSVIAGALKESIDKIEEDNEKIKILENEVKELEAKNKALEELVHSMNERLLNLEDK